jgi:hypothetical protein
MGVFALEDSEPSLPQPNDPLIIGYCEGAKKAAQSNASDLGSAPGLQSYGQRWKVTK